MKTERNKEAEEEKEIKGLSEEEKQEMKRNVEKMAENDPLD